MVFDNDIFEDKHILEIAKIMKKYFNNEIEKLDTLKKIKDICEECIK